MNMNKDISSPVVTTTFTNLETEHDFKQTVARITYLQSLIEEEENRIANYFQKQRQKVATQKR